MPGPQGNVVVPKVVAIANAASPIGEATARHLAARGFSLILGVPGTDRFAPQDAAQALVQPLNVADRGDFEAFVAVAVAAFGRIDAVVNEATGVGDQGIGGNMRGLLNGIAATLPQMQAQQAGGEGAGHFVHIAPFDGRGTDIFAVRALSEGLRIRHDPIGVSVIPSGEGLGNLVPASPDAVAWAIGDAIARHADMLEIAAAAFRSAA